MKFVLSLLAIGAVAFLYLQRANRKTSPPAGQVREDFVAGFEQLFTMQCSGDTPAKSAWCACMLQEMLQAKTIQPSMEDLEKSQAILARYRASEPGKISEKKCGVPSPDLQEPPAGE
ncbi:MAG: hypothetical protein HUU37_00070 [Bdellovibrionales bacterium]|nr:hypothetical protein [Bdellovibrionales bacterium]